MNRRSFIRHLALSSTALASVGTNQLSGAEPEAKTGPVAAASPESLRQDWLARWEKNILSDSRNRYCDKEMGEELGWLVSPFLNGFYYGYLATRDPKWVAMLTRLDGFLHQTRGQGTGRLSRLAQG